MASDPKDFTMADSGSETSADDMLPEVSFSTFVISLNASALMHMGAIADPTSGETAKNLPLAKQTIDIMAMLEKKTKGNLETDEAQMLKNILYDLRMIYVRETQ